MALVLIPALLLSEISFASDGLNLAAKSMANRMAIEAKMYRDSEFVWTAHPGKRDYNRLEKLAAKAMIFPSGRISVRADVLSDERDFPLIRSARHEHFEILMQRVEEKKYKELQAAALNSGDILKAYYFQLPEERQKTIGRISLDPILKDIRARYELKNKKNRPVEDQERDILFNDIMATCFEIRSSLEDGIVFRTNIPEAELALFDIVESLGIINTSNFPEIFFNQKERYEYVFNLQRDRSEKFERVAQAEGAISGQEPTGQFGRRAELLRVNIKEKKKTFTIIRRDAKKVEYKTTISMNLEESGFGIEDLKIWAADNKNVKDEAHRALILKILELFEISPPKNGLYTFTARVEDFFGFASANYEMIALHEGLKDTPLALLHEICHYLIHKKLLTLDTSNGTLSADLDGNRLQIRIPRRTLRNLVDEEWWSWNDRTIKNKSNGIENHNLIRILQEAIFGEEDRLLTEKVRALREGRAARKKRGGRKDMSGYGFKGGYLSAEEMEYRTLLVRRFTHPRYGFSTDEADTIAGTLLYAREETMRAAMPELFDKTDIHFILTRKMFDIDEFAERLIRERENYRSEKGADGESMFSEDMIRALLFKRFIPLRIVRRLMDDEGFSKTETIEFLTRSPNPENELKVIKPMIRDLKKRGLNKREYMQLIISHEDPVGEWDNKRKPVRDIMIKSGLKKSDATQMVLMWRDPEKEWSLRKPMIEKFVTDGVLERVYATYVVVRFSNPELKIKTINSVTPILKEILGTTEAEARRYVLKHSRRTIAALLKDKYGLDDAEIRKILAPLEEYEKNYGRNEPKDIAEPAPEARPAPLAELGYGAGETKLPGPSLKSFIFIGTFAGILLNCCFGMPDTAILLGAIFDIVTIASRASALPDPSGDPEEAARARAETFKESLKGTLVQIKDSIRKEKEETRVRILGIEKTIASIERSNASSSRFIERMKSDKDEIEADMVKKKEDRHNLQKRISSVESSITKWEKLCEKNNRDKEEIIREKELLERYLGLLEDIDAEKDISPDLGEPSDGESFAANLRPDAAEEEPKAKLASLRERCDSLLGQIAILENKQAHGKTRITKKELDEGDDTLAHGTGGYGAAFPDYESGDEDMMIDIQEKLMELSSLVAVIEEEMRILQERIDSTPPETEGGNPLLPLGADVYDSKRDGTHGEWETAHGKGDEISDISLLGPLKEAFTELAAVSKRAYLTLDNCLFQLGKKCRRAKEISKLRLCIPVEVLKKCADMATALKPLMVLPEKNGKIPFELVITDVTDEDIQAVENLKNDPGIRQALNLPANFDMEIITRERMWQWAKACTKPNYDPDTPAGKARMVRDSYRNSRKGEYTAVVTDAVTDNGAVLIERELEYDGETGEENISIRIPVLSGDLRRSDGIYFLLSDILNQWLVDISNGKSFARERVFPVLVSATEEIEKYIIAAWKQLSSA